MSAVSYTHLDVYKRQVSTGAGAAVGGVAGFGFGGFGAIVGGVIGGALGGAGWDAATEAAGVCQL